jgi:hypothetical protein
MQDTVKERTMIIGVFLQDNNGNYEKAIPIIRASDVTNVDRRTLTKACRSGALEGYQMAGGYWLTSAEAVQRWKTKQPHRGGRPAKSKPLKRTQNRRVTRHQPIGTK